MHSLVAVAGLASLEGRRRRWARFARSRRRHVYADFRVRLAGNRPENLSGRCGNDENWEKRMEPAEIPWAGPDPSVSRTSTSLNCR